MESAVVRKKGQITLPSKLREDLKLHEGDVIYFDRQGDDTVLIRAEDIIARTAGALKTYVTDGPVVWDRDEIWGEIATEREERVLKQIAEEETSYDID